MAKNNDVKFIRKKGRIIPIRAKGSKPEATKKTKEQKAQAKKASLFSLGGVGLSVLAGTTSGRTKAKAIKRKQMAFSFMQEDSFALPKGLKKSTVEGIQKTSRYTARGGQVLGGALLSQGVQQFLKSQGVESESLALPIGAELASQAAAEIIARQARKSSGGKFFTGTKRKKFIEATKKISSFGKRVASKFVSRQMRFKF